MNLMMMMWSVFECVEVDDFEIIMCLGLVMLCMEWLSVSVFVWCVSVDGGVLESVAASSVEEEVDDGAARVNVYVGRYVYILLVLLILRNVDRGVVMLKEYVGECVVVFVEMEVRAYERLLADDDVEIEVDEYG